MSETTAGFGGRWMGLQSWQACDANDVSHFQNLNAGLGSLAEVVSFSQGPISPYTMMAGLGVNGTAGVKTTSGPTAQWPQILGGFGGPVTIDPANASNWYVNNQAGFDQSILHADGRLHCGRLWCEPCVIKNPGSGTVRRRIASEKRE